MLNKISCLTKAETEALYSMFEHVANSQTSHLYIDDLRIVARLIDMSDEQFIRETGFEPISADEYYEKLYGDED